MCGITGIIDINNSPLQPDVLLAMTRAIAHRGPDDEGYVLIGQSDAAYRCYAGQDSVPEIKERFPLLGTGADILQPNIGLGQRRFSIIDLSYKGHQPFMDAQGKCCAILNGEIYNYVELKEELEHLGHRFFSTSDTEVLAEAYKAWGVECFSRFNGFWAVAIYDFERGRLIISRDRLGKKPLYWTKKGSRIYFASELKALLKIPEFISGQNRVNEEALYFWLEYGLRDYSAATFFDGIFCLQPASWAVLDRDFPNNIKTFWEIPQKRMTEKDISVEDACGKIKDTLMDAVKIRLRADVPWSIELSGGMDSSTLVALASEVSKEKTHVVTVRFPEKEWNEEPYARSMTERYDLDYHVLEPPLVDFWQGIRYFTFLHEEPYHSPNYSVSQLYWGLMRGANTKVSLQGTGGDELFAGYNYYFPLALIEAVKKGNISHFAGNLFNWTEYRQGFRANLGIVEYLVRTFFPKVRFKHRLWRNYIRIKPPETGRFALKNLNEALYNDMTKTKMYYWLLSFDKNYMGMPIEIRAPLLDYRVVEFVSSLPLSYLIRDGWHKWIFRKSMEDMLPHKVVWRKQKMGFPFPYDRFMTQSAKIVETILAGADNPFLDFSKQEYFRTDWYVITYLLWYEMFINKNRDLFDRLDAIIGPGDHFAGYTFRPEYLNRFSAI